MVKMCMYIDLLVLINCLPPPIIIFILDNWRIKAVFFFRRSCPGNSVYIVYLFPPLLLLCFVLLKLFCCDVQYSRFHVELKGVKRESV